MRLQKRGKVGDTVRLYGLSGTFTIGNRSLLSDICKQAGYDHAVLRDGKYLFPTVDVNIIEVNGMPVPLLSKPIAPIQHDYPHKLKIVDLDSTIEHPERFDQL